MMNKTQEQAYARSLTALVTITEEKLRVMKQITLIMRVIAQYPDDPTRWLPDAPWPSQKWVVRRKNGQYVRSQASGQVSGTLTGPLGTAYAFGSAEGAERFAVRVGGEALAFEAACQEEAERATTMPRTSTEELLGP